MEQTIEGKQKGMKTVKNVYRWPNYNQTPHIRYFTKAVAVPNEHNLHLKFITTLWRGGTFYLTDLCTIRNILIYQMFLMDILKFF